MTPAVKLVKNSGVAYTLHAYDNDPRESSYGLEAAALLDIDPPRVFKTLVLQLSDNRLAVVIIPVNKQVSMKKAAATLGSKKAQMAAPDKVQNSTGYVLGGVSPLGQQRKLPTVLDTSALSQDTIFVSAGKRGLEIELSAQDLIDLCTAQVADLVAD
jgi:Cys-tRNA(Pro)/Cys-tRNA(Cys) deacylase